MDEHAKWCVGLRSSGLYKEGVMAAIWNPFWRPPSQRDCQHLWYTQIIQNIGTAGTASRHFDCLCISSV